MSEMQVEEILGPSDMSENERTKIELVFKHCVWFLPDFSHRKEPGAEKIELTFSRDDDLHNMELMCGYGLGVKISRPAAESTGEKKNITNRQ
jgi:hypothetical protein